ncbi:Non-ribosomal peptide synthetase modules and related protein [Hahella chejuensis KCTC 2396]|uniref:Non-ribosomal peptide synthetase modules and related protein n=1 Tax=Hahella chejuensis (strain KCTC 2396) TaxID=349521 RepID=Q2S820_HAHCH|nr:non-ribosomal peptide synthetase [Hahella chejuensis]ABC33204.1 Non-ribosomal peptide synthetase modules and related protein [Hahella chejuensis KCTC 2396]
MTTPAETSPKGLSAAQAGIWLGQQINPASPMYNAAEFVELRGPLQVELFERALRQALIEAPALHATFHSGAREAAQRLHAPAFTLIHKDYSHFEAPLEQARLWMLSDLAATVDLSQGPLFTQALIKLGEDHYCWHQRIHHIACDGFAFALLSQRVAEIYNALAANPETDPATVGRAFGDYNKVLEEDLRYRQSPAFTKDRDFWAGYLDGQTPPVSLSRSNAPIADMATRVERSLPATLIKQLQAAASTIGATWSDALTAATAYLIHRRTGAREITLGAPVMGRMGSASLRVPAMVMNIIPLRIKVSEAASFKDLVQLAAQQTRLTRMHQRYRYEQLRRDLNRVGGDQRLFGPVVNIMPFDRHVEFQGCDSRTHNLCAGPVEDLSFAFILNKDGGLRFDLDANPNRYDTSALQQIQQQLLDLLEQAAAHLEQPLQADRDALSWLQGPTPSISPQPTLQTIRERILATPDAVALQANGRCLTYAELGQRVTCLASQLRQAGVKPGDKVALALPRSEGAIVAALATWAAKAAFVFLDPAAPATRNSLIIEDARPALVVVEETGMDLGENLQAPTLALSGLTQTADAAALWPQDGAQQGAAYLIYTSGSTGTPKGVVIGHQALAEFVAGAIDAYAVTASDRVLQFAPLHFDACIEEIFVTLAQGARLILRNDAMLESAPRFLEQCRQWGVTLLDLPTAYWHELAFGCVTASLALPPSLRAVIIGGEAVLPERVAQWRDCFGDRIALYNTYGPSEATVVATSADLSVDAGAISIGQPLGGRSIAIVNPQGDLLPRGEEGELLLLGGGLADGYLNLPEKTAESFISIRFPWSREPERAYRSGDRARINAQGNVEFLGRLDDQIKISGHRIDPLEIESALSALPGVQEAAVTLSVQGEGVKCLVAHLSGRAYSIAELREALQNRLPTAMIPSALAMHEHLPKNAAGKVDRKQLCALDVAAASDAPQTEATTEQQIIIDVWREVLGQSAIKPEDDFFLLGGQSLQSIQVANRLSARLGREVPVTLIFQSPTVAALAQALFAADDAQPQSRNLREQMLADCEAFAQSLPPAPVNAFDLNAAPKQILLTGATGFVGAQLLHQLLNQTDADILCAVRGATDAEAFYRLEQAMSEQGLPCTGFKRVRVLLADMEKPRLGLSTEDFEHLAQHIDAVIHNAAVTSVMRDYQSLRAANTLSTGELLKLAAVRGAPLHLVSTIAVAPPASVAPALREDFTPVHDGLGDGYQQSKWASERMAEIARDKGYPVNLYRLARVTGASDFGYINAKDLVWSIIQAGMRSDALPDLPISEPWTPVDAVAQFIVADAMSRPGGGVYNVTPPQDISLGRIFDWLRDYGFDFDTLPLPQWSQRVKERGAEEDQAILGFFEQRSHDAGAPSFEPGGVDNAKFRQRMEELGLTMPVIDQPLFHRYLQYAIESGLLRTANRTAVNKHSFISSRG